MSKPRRPELRFLVTVVRSEKVVRFQADIVSLTEDGKVRNIRADWAGDPLWGLQDLTVTAQANLDRGEDGDFYATKVEYRDVYSVGLKDAEVMVKTLRKIKRVFDADGNTEFDWGHGVGEHLRLVSKALGVGGYIVNAGKSGTGDWGHDGIDYRDLSLADVENLAAGYVTNNLLSAVR